MEFTKHEGDASPPRGGDENTASARVVGIDGDRVWLEPIQTGSCGSCASAALCGSKGIGSLANRLEARRFFVYGSDGLRIGDSVQVVFGGRNLVKAAAIAYAVPLLSALVVASIAQACSGHDGLAMLGALVGMASGFSVMRIMAKRLEARGDLDARIVRRNIHSIHFSHPGAHCDA